MRFDKSFNSTIKYGYQVDIIIYKKSERELINIGGIVLGLTLIREK